MFTWFYNFKCAVDVSGSGDYLFAYEELNLVLFYMLDGGLRDLSLFFE